MLCKNHSLLLLAGMLTLHAASATAANTDTIRQRWSVAGDSLIGSEEKPQELAAQATLEECIHFAMRSNPGLRADFHLWEAAIERVPQVQALDDPRLSWIYYIQAVETRVGPQRQSLSLSQTFPWFGKLKARGDIALSQAVATEQKFEARRLRLIRNITRDYASLHFVSRSLRITEDNLILVRNWEDVSRARFRTGKGSHADVIKAQVEMGIVEDRIRSLRDQRVALVAKVNAHLPRPMDTPLTTQAPAAHEWLIDEHQLLADLRANNPGLRGLAAQIEARRHAQRLAGKQAYPNFSLGVSWIDTGEALNPGMLDSGKDAFMAKLGITLPIWRGRIGAERREADARFRATSFERVNLLQQLEASVKQQAFTLRDAQRRVRLYRDTLVPKGNQSLRATATAFESGSVDFLSLIDALRVLLEFELNLERARTEQMTARGDLEMLVGSRLPLATGDGTDP